MLGRRPIPHPDVSGGSIQSMGAVMLGLEHSYREHK